MENSLNSYKTKLEDLCRQNRREDIAENQSYWDSVFSDIINAKTEAELSEIALLDFGYEDINDVKPINL